MEWFSYVVAIILLISSILSPVLVARENNKHQLSLKKLDMYEESKRKALNDFIRASSNLYKSDVLGTIDEFYRSANCLFIYFKDVPFDIDSLKNSRDEPNFFNYLTSIVQDLSKQLSKE